MACDYTKHVPSPIAMPNHSFLLSGGVLTCTRPGFNPQNCKQQNKRNMETERRENSCGTEVSGQVQDHSPRGSCPRACLLEKHSANLNGEDGSSSTYEQVKKAQLRAAETGLGHTMGRSSLPRLPMLWYSHFGSEEKKISCQCGLWHKYALEGMYQHAQKALPVCAESMAEKTWQCDSPLALSWKCKKARASTQVCVLLEKNTSWGHRLIGPVKEQLEKLPGKQQTKKKKKMGGWREKKGQDQP